MTSARKFYVYTHIRCDKEAIFYIGKGCGNRAFSRQSRNLWWRNIVNKTKYRVHIVADRLSEKEAFSIESELIEWAKNLKLPIVNLCSGGSGISGYKHSAISKEKMRTKALGRTVSLDTRILISEKLSGKVKPKRTSEHCEAISKSHKGKKCPPEFRVKMAEVVGSRVIVCSNGMEFYSAAEAARWATGEDIKLKYSSTASHIIQCCKDKRKSSKGFQWKYK